MTESRQAERLKPGLASILSQVRRKEIYLNIPIHLFILIPASVFLAFLSRRLDQVLGWEPYLTFPANAIIAVCCFSIGLFIVWYTYGYLLIMGEGSPGSHLGGGTTKMVTKGIYAVVRHPSVIGKLIGVIGLGVLFRSPAMTFIIIPVLVLYSLLTNRFIQEKYCEEKFGDAYREYRNRTPMLIPRPAALAAWWRGEFD